MKRTIERITCDVCECEVLLRDFATITSFGTDMDICRECVRVVHHDVELAYRRLIHGQVPDRRGGWRQLGEYDG